MFVVAAAAASAPSCSPALPKRGAIWRHPDCWGCLACWVAPRAATPSLLTGPLLPPDPSLAAIDSYQVIGTPSGGATTQTPVLTVTGLGTSVAGTKNVRLLTDHALPSCAPPCCALPCCAVICAHAAARPAVAEPRECGMRHAALCLPCVLRLMVGRCIRAMSAPAPVFLSCQGTIINPPHFLLAAAVHLHDVHSCQDVQFYRARPQQRWMGAVIRCYATESSRRGSVSRQLGARASLLVAMTCCLLRGDEHGLAG